MSELINIGTEGRDVSGLSRTFLFRQNLLFGFVFLMCLFSLSSLHAQYEHIEKLENMLPELTADTAIVDVLNELSYEYYMIDIEKTEVYSQDALKKAKQINYQAGISQALNYLAIAYAVKGDQLKSIELNEESLRIATKINNAQLLANASNDIGISYDELGMQEKAIEFYQKSLKYSHLQNDDKLTCFTLSNLGFLYEKMGYHEQSESYNNKIIKVASQSDHHMLQAFPDMYRAKNFVLHENYQEAMEAYNLAFDKAYGPFQQSKIRLDQAKMLESLDKISSAEKLILEALELLESAGNKEEMEQTIHIYAKVLIKGGKYNQALGLINDFLENKESTQISPIYYKDLIALRIDALKALKDYPAVVENYELFQSLQDSVFNKQKLTLVAETEAKFRLEEKEKENKFLRVQKEQNVQLLAQQKTNAFYLSALIIMISLLTFFLYWAYRNNKAFNSSLQKRVDLKTKELKESNLQLKESNEQLERFAFIASHDLKTPLRNIISFIGLLEKQVKTYENERMDEYIRYIKSAGLRMNDLIVGVLEYSRLSGGEEESTEVVDLNEVLDEVLKGLSGFIKQKEAKITRDADLPVIKGNKASLALLLQNFTNNSITYNEAKVPTLKIYAAESKDSVSLFFADNGIGIPKEYRQKIFGMFTRLHSQAEYEGSGLGLSVCKKIVAQMNGQIFLESQEGKGSTFEIRFPKSIAVLKSQAKTKLPSGKTLSEIHDTVDLLLSDTAK